MIGSTETLPLRSDCVTNKKNKPQRILSLNVNVRSHEEMGITVAKNSSSSYIVQNHSPFNDLTGSTASSSKYIFEKAFFGGKDEPRIQQDVSLMSDNYCVIQKSNGKDMEDTVNHLFIPL